MKTKDYLFTLVPIVGAFFYMKEVLPIIGRKAYRTFWYWFMLVWHFIFIVSPVILLAINQ